ncbi:hypothetical protein N0V85_009491 [Neurospora sp. IMI 360204]|nr:hypothetical protein N0V85_009491 [Neurospora sp. IMI 360204]
MAKSEPPARPEAGTEEPLQDSEAHVRDDNKQDEGASEDKHASEQEDKGEEAQVPEAFYHPLFLEQLAGVSGKAIDDSPILPEELLVYNYPPPPGFPGIESEDDPVGDSRKKRRLH